MSIFGDLERFAADHLYPYRWPISILLPLLLAAVVFFAYRRGWHRSLWRHRVVTGIIAVPLLVVAIPSGYYTLSPLWTRTHLEEMSPLAVNAEVVAGTGGEARASAAPEASTRARITYTGEIKGADSFHYGRG